MYRKVEYKETDFHVGKRYAHLKDPNQCPMCNLGIKPKYINQNYNHESELMSIMFECPACDRTFLAHYYDPSDSVYQPSTCKVFPKFPIEKNFDKDLKILSPEFEKIYNQAIIAEDHNLDQIAGMGYRKALEFLIKDFCISEKPDEREKIENNFLGKVIEEYIEDRIIKNLATYSAWLGNDETHYKRKWKEKDIEDLKKFIDATVYFVSYKIIAKSAEAIVTNKR
ncbi:MAG TPA: DUF4145 domain-containing protein [Gallicola sp.]|nr:DUF4145 domain-containing protein [Gallicola sp.]